MRKVTPDVAFEDDRGTITDLVEAHVNAITRVRTTAGSVRGNHLHRLTTQWTFVVSGRLRITTDKQTLTADAGDLVVNPAGEPHAWEALEDTDCVVFARGPRAGRNYESDTYRLDEPLVRRV